MAISGRNLSWSRTTYNVSGYGVVGESNRWSTFMDNHAISFIPTSASQEEVQGKSYSGTAQVTLSQAGTYRIKVAADNAGPGYSSATFDEKPLSIGNLNTEGSETSYTVPVGEAPKTVTLSITIANEDTGVTINSFAENPMGMAILIEEPGSKSETEGAGQDCPPGPWVPAIPSCASTPRLVSNTTNGLQIKKSGSSNVILNLKNYANKLVTLKVVVNKSASWTNGFSSSITEASDIVVGNASYGGDIPYSKFAYSESSLDGGNTVIHFCNLDGGDYDYTFTHSSTPNPNDQPRRAINALVPSTSQYIDENGDLVTKTTYNCEQVSTEYYSPWPACTPGVAITKNGGNEVRWCYEDGGGAPFCDQTVTVTVLSTRDVITTSGDVCFTDIVNKVWIDDLEVSKTNEAKIWSDGVSSNGLLISGTEGLMFDGSLNTKVTTQGEGLVDFIQWDKTGVVNLTELMAPVKLRMVYRAGHTFHVNRNEINLESLLDEGITLESLLDGEVVTIKIADGETAVDSFKVEAGNTETPVEIYAVEANGVIVEDDVPFIAEGKSITDYKNHSTKIRFRDPASRASKTTFPDPLCFTDFRGLAGAKTPSELGII